MTKLEEKLIMLGYKEEFPKGIYNKDIMKPQIALKIDIKNLNNSRVFCAYCSFKTQQDIDNLQQAFNQLQKDLEVLKDET